MGLITRAFETAARRAAVTAGPTTIEGTSSTAISMRQHRLPKSTVELYRRWGSHGEFVRTAVDLRKGQLERADWELIPWDRDGPTPDKGLMKRMTEILSAPSPADASFSTFISSVAEDMLVLDAGAIEKERKLKGEIIWLWATDGGRVKADRYWDGDPQSPRYWWEKTATVDTPLLNRDLIYAIIHNRSYTPIGLSYLETLKHAIDAELSGSTFNARAVTQSAPDGVMDLGENARPDQVDAFKAYFRSEVTGATDGLISFWGGTKNAKFIPFRPSNHDMQYLEWLQYNATKVAAVFQISVQDLQLLHDINRSQGEVQQANTEDRGFKTIAGKVQDYLTAEFCWDEGFGGRKNNIAFRFRAVSDHASKAKADVHKITLAGMPSQSINEARRDLGLPPIGDPSDEANPFNKLMANTPVGLVLLDAIPTAEDYLDARKAAGEPPPGAPKPGGDDDSPARIKQLERDLDLLQKADTRTEAGREVVASSMKSVVEALATNQQAFAGEMRAMVETITAKPVEVGAQLALAPGRGDRVVKETFFKTDDKGRIIGKTETERLDRGRTVRETVYKTDAEGKIVGKTEIEVEEDPDADQ